MKTPIVRWQTINGWQLAIGGGGGETRNYRSFESVRFALLLSSYSTAHAIETAQSPAVEAVVVLCCGEFIEHWAALPGRKIGHLVILLSVWESTVQSIDLLLLHTIGRRRRFFLLFFDCLFPSSQRRHCSNALVVSWPFLHPSLLLLFLLFLSRIFRDHFWSFYFATASS